MIKLSHFLFCAACLILLIPFVVKAQNPPPPPPPAPPRAIVSGSGSGVGVGSYKTDDEDSDDTKITGATVRGRVVYEDTGRPLRYGLVTLIIDSAARYPGKFVKTDENGEFVMRNVKEGTYVAYIKSEGILTPAENTPAIEGQPTVDTVTKYAVGGLGEVQIVVQAKRGGAVGGRVAYSDGESAAGVKVEALRKYGERFIDISGYGTSVGTAQTDDRGVYRLAGLPDGSYLIRVTEPSSNNKSETNYGYGGSNSASSLLKTYYPQGDDSKTAKPIEVAAGQEQTSIDLTLPERKLYTIAGRIISKKERQPLEKFSVGFTKISDADALVSNYGGGNAVNSKKSGAYELTSLTKGKYRITVNQSYAYRDPKDTSPKPPDYPTITKEIEITDKNIDDLTFEIPTASTLRGTIIFEGTADVPAGMPVLAFSETAGQPPLSGYIAESNAEKSSAVKSRDFQIAKMSAGKYRLAFRDRDFYVKSITVGGRDVTRSAIEIDEGEDLGGVQILMAANSAAVKGKVTGYETGARAGVIAVKSSSNFEELRYNSISANIAANGDYEIKLAPGDYLLFVITEKNSPKSEAGFKEWYENIIKDAAKITVKANETQTLNLTFPK